MFYYNTILCKEKIVDHLNFIAYLPSPCSCHLEKGKHIFSFFMLGTHVVPSMALNNGMSSLFRGAYLTSSILHQAINMTARNTVGTQSFI